MKRINKEIDNCLHFLFHCSLKDTEFETQREQFREVYNYIENLKESDIKLLLIVIDKLLGDNVE